MTANKAAAEIRHKILRKMTELDSDLGPHQSADKWTRLRDYIKAMAPRASKKIGGLGRK